MSSTVTAKLSADASDFKSVMTDAANFTGGIAGKIGHHFTSATFIARSAATALGLHFTDLADKLVEPFKEGAEAAKTVAEESEKATAAVLALISAHQNEEQQLITLRKEARHLREELEAPAKSKNSLSTFFLGLLSPIAAVLKIHKEYTEELEHEEKVAKAVTGLQVNALEQHKKENALKLEGIKFEEDMYKYAVANRTELELEAKLKLGTINPAEMDQLRIIRLQNKEKLIQTEINILLEKPVKDWTQQEKIRFQVLQNQTKEIENQIGLIAHPMVAAIADATKETNSFVLSMDSLFDEVANVTKAWEDFKISISTTGRGNKDLSDAELQKKISTTQADIMQREISLRGQAGMAGSSPYDSLLNPQKSNLEQALNEMRLRTDIRGNAMAFGKDRAFQDFGGNQQRFDQILSGASPADQTRLANAMEKLNRHFERGVPFVFAPATGSPQGQITPLIPNG